MLPEPPHGTADETFRGKPEWQRIKQMDVDWQKYEPVEAMPQKPWDPENPRYMALLKTLKAVDDSLGRVIAALDRIGELDNTIIVYSSDNGYFMGEHTYWDKRIAYEPSMRIPLIVRFPGGLGAGTKRDALVTNLDIMPTFLQLGGAKVPAHVQGASLMPLVTDPSVHKLHDSVMFEYYVDDAYPYAGPDLVALRTDRYKLVDNFLENDIDEFYDLAEDPGEMRNLIGDAGSQAMVAHHRDLLVQEMAKYRYTFDRDWHLRKLES